jgi:hypothetical protein
VAKQRWINSLANFTDEFVRTHALLAPFTKHAAIVLHGSTCRGIDDTFADLDVWLILPESDLKALDASSSTRFFEFQLEGKPGHFNAVAFESFRQRVQNCDLTIISELRAAQVISDPQKKAMQLITCARNAMPADVREAFFRYHYVEFRGDDRAADNPLARGDPVAALLAQSAALAHALQAAMVLYGEPYPYSKWLHRCALETPTGRALEPRIGEWLCLLAADALRNPAGSNPHSLAAKTKEMRLILIDAAKSAGIDEPWLNQWWLHIDTARAGIIDLKWSMTC